MKIGLVLSKTPSYSETFFVSKIEGLLQSGFDVTLFVQKVSKDFRLCPVKIAPKVFKSNVFFQFFNSLFVLVRLLIFPSKVQKFIQLERHYKRSWKQIIKNLYNNSHLLTSNLDWVHFGFATIALQSEHVAEAIGAKMAVSFRGFDLDVYPLKHPNCYSLLWKKATKVHSISNYLMQKALTLGLSKNVPYQIITPAIDISKCINKVKNTSETIHFLTIARLHWIKGISYTLDTLLLLKNKGIKFKYTIIGEGAEHENIVYNINQLQLNDEVKLVGKKLHDEVLSYLKTTDIYIQYSDSEGFCNALLEAQAMKVLCVASNGGALPENINHKKTGWIVPKRNPKKLAKTILEVINLPEEEKQIIVNNAHDRVVNEFNIEKQQKEFLKLYS